MSAMATLFLDFEAFAKSYKMQLQKPTKTFCKFL